MTSAGKHGSSQGTDPGTGPYKAQTRSVFSRKPPRGLDSTDFYKGEPQPTTFHHRALTEAAKL